MFYSSIGINSSSDDFYDQDIVSILTKSKGSVNSEFIPRKIKIPNKDTTVDVLTIILAGTKLEDNGLPEGAIILNLNVNEIENYFKNISNVNNNLFAINNNGNIVLSSKSSSFYQDISNLNYVKQILSSNDSQGYFTEKIDGTSYIIHFMTPEGTNLKFINLTPYETLLKSMNRMLNLLLIMFIIIFIIGILISYFISKKIYSPLGRIVKYVKTNLSSYDTMKKNENELDYLSSAINNLLTTSLSLKNLSNEDNLFIKQNVLKDLILHPLSDVKLIKKNLMDLNIHLDPKNLIIFILRIDSYKKFTSIYSKNDLELFQYALSNVSKEITSTKYNCEVVDMETNHISIILNTELQPLSQSLNSIIEIIKQIQDVILNFLHFSVTAGIGDFTSNFSELSESYKHAYEYTNYKIKYGPNSILYYDKIVPGIKESHHYPVEKEKLLFDAIKCGKIEDVDVHLTNILEEILNYNYFDMLMYIIQLVLNSKKLLNNFKIVNNKGLPINLDFLKENLEKFESINEIHDWLMTSYNETLLQLQESKDQKKENLVNKIISYIELNYCNPELSPEYLADYVSISPNYLRTIFKIVRNQSLSTYINEYRFEKAKHLLENTNLSVADIATKIGFANTNYFYTCFKKYYGVSPTEWRKRL